MAQLWTDFHKVLSFDRNRAAALDALISALIAGKSDAEIRKSVKILHAKRTDPANALATV